MKFENGEHIFVIHSNKQSIIEYLILYCDENYTYARHDNVYKENGEIIKNPYGNKTLKFNNNSFDRCMIGKTLKEAINLIDIIDILE